MSKYTPIIVRTTNDDELWLTASEARALARRLTRELTVYERLRKLHGVKKARGMMAKRQERQGVL